MQITENQVVGVVKEKNKYVPIIEGNQELKTLMVILPEVDLF